MRLWHFCVVVVVDYDVRFLKIEEGHVREFFGNDTRNGGVFWTWLSKRHFRQLVQIRVTHEAHQLFAVCPNAQHHLDN